MNKTDAATMTMNTNMTAARRRCKSPTTTKREKLHQQQPSYHHHHHHHHQQHSQDHSTSDQDDFVLYSNLKKFMFLFMIIWSFIMIQTLYKIQLGHYGGGYKGYKEYEERDTTSRTTRTRRRRSITTTSSSNVFPTSTEKKNIKEQFQFPFMKQLPSSTSASTATTSSTTTTTTTTSNTSQCSTTPIQPEDIDYTLVTHSSEDRLWMMEHHCQRWGYDRQISIAVFTNQSVESIYLILEAMGCHREQILLQTVEVGVPPNNNNNNATKIHDHSIDHNSKEDSHSHSNSLLENYPINKLRNMALSNVKTSHVLLLDIDFLESQNLYNTLQRKDVKKVFAEDDKMAIVVPAFQLNRRCSVEEECDVRNIRSMPYTREELKKLILKGHATMFDPTNRGGHGTTKYSLWMQKTSPGLIDIDCIKSKRYEPYVVVRYCAGAGADSLPPFQERFNGYGKNKLAWMLHLLRVGYKLKQLDQDFVIHYPHEDSKARKEWNKRPQHMRKHVKAAQLVEGKEGSSIDWSMYRRGQIDSLYVEFQRWLDSEIEDATRVPACSKYGDDTNLWINNKKNKKKG